MRHKRQRTPAEIPQNVTFSLVCHAIWDSHNAVKRRFTALLQDRRGASAVAFAASAMVIMGFVGLATEGGLWYLGRRDTQGAADAAAVAGALAITYNANATTAALNSAASNGFPNSGDSTVAVNVVPATATQTAQVQVTVSQQMVPFISALFTSTPTTVGATATAQVKPTGSACVLSTSGDLSITGTSISSGCAFASNSTSSTALNVTAGLLGSTAATVGGCCGSGTVTLNGRPASPYHPATVNPYTAADALSFPTFNAGNCDTFPSSLPYHGSNGLYQGKNVVLLVPYNPASPRAYCNATLTVTAGTTVLVPSGTYFFNNASLTMSGGVMSCDLTCAPGGNVGATFIFTGDTGNIGTVTITGGTFSVIAQKTNASYSDLNGILFYGRGLGTATVAASNTSGKQPLGGGIYFPNSILQFTGNYLNPSSCVSMVANTVVLYGRTSVATTGCGSYGTSLAMMQGVRIVQ